VDSLRLELLISLDSVDAVFFGWDLEHAELFLIDLDCYKVVVSKAGWFSI
jgi:hypothetical protein